jgi:hypothetical protein
MAGGNESSIEFALSFQSTKTYPSNIYLRLHHYYNAFDSNKSGVKKHVYMEATVRELGTGKLILPQDHEVCVNFDPGYTYYRAVNRCGNQEDDQKEKNIVSKNLALMGYYQFGFKYQKTNFIAEELTIKGLNVPKSIG